MVRSVIIESLCMRSGVREWEKWRAYEARYEDMQ